MKLSNQMFAMSGAAISLGAFCLASSNINLSKASLSSHGFREEYSKAPGLNSLVTASTVAAPIFLGIGFMIRNAEMAANRARK